MASKRRNMFHKNKTQETTEEVTQAEDGVQAPKHVLQEQEAGDNGNRTFWCSCFKGFSGPDCSQGPLCKPDSNVCRNGATCRHVGMSAVCHCTAGFTGPYCDAPVLQQGCDNDEECITQCRFDGSIENACNCDATGTRVSSERSRFEMRIKLANVSTQRIKHPGRTLNHFLEKQILKFLRISAVSNVEDLQVLNISVVYFLWSSGAGDVVFHFFGSGHDVGRVKEAGSHLVERGRLGEVHLVPGQISMVQEPALALESVRVRHKEQMIREGDQFMLSCVAQGSSYMTFQWFKDGALINPKKSLRTIWTQLLPLDSHEQYTAILGLENVDAMDEGQYTCQVVDWGVQECKSIYIEIKQPPQVVISPMSATVHKGGNINLKCMSQNARGDEQTGYSWTRDNSLFPMIRGKEYWEDLKPGGTILRIFNIQKSTTYTCQAHTSVATQSQSVRVDVINRTNIAVCQAESVDGVTWGDASPGSTAISDCPTRYVGTAKRLCLISEPGKALWLRPDFSECVSYIVYKIITKFHALTRGFEVTNPKRTLQGLKAVLQDRSVLYPGEGEPIVALLHEILSYINQTNGWETLVNTTQNFFDTVNSLLEFNTAVINPERAEMLEVVVKNWALYWGVFINSSVGHLSFNNLIVDVVSFQNETPNSFYIPILSTSYPIWFNSKLAIHVVGQNKTLPKQNPNRIVVVSYRNLTNYLSAISTQKLEDGSEMTYEIMSDIISVSASGALRDLQIKLELPLKRVREGWNITCAVASSLGADWEFKACNYSLKNVNVSQCVCHTLGVYAAMSTSHSTFDFQSMNKAFQPSSIVVVGCACCLLQTVLTLVILLIQCLHHTTCILILKLQCCTTVAIFMMIFIYTSKNAVMQYSYSYVSTIIELLIFIGISTHLSKLLIIYTEVVRLPNIRNLKYTVFGIVSGVIVLILLCSLLAHHLSGNILSSWWLPYNSTLFYIAASCGALLVILFTFLYCNLMHRLKLMLSAQHSKSSRIVSRRMKLLKRTAVLFVSMLIMTICSILYVNIPLKLYQYLFSISCAALGLIMLLCYVLCSEISMHHLVFKHLKFDKGKEKDCNSDSDNNLFDFFTKQEPELESDSAPPCMKKPVILPLNDLVSEIENSSIKPKMITFNSSPQISKKTPDKEEVDLEDYPNSPRKYVQITGGGDASRPVTYQFDESNYPSAIVHSSDRGGRDLCVEYIGSSCGDDVVSARVRLELDVVQSVLNPSSTVETPLVKCSIDLESAPCTSSAGLNEFTVTSGDSSKSCHVELKETEPSEQSPECGDVLDRISHDLDYLLNRTSDTGGGSDTFKRQRTTAVSTEPNVQGSKANSSS